MSRPTVPWKDFLYQIFYFYSMYLNIAAVLGFALLVDPSLCTTLLSLCFALIAAPSLCTTLLSLAVVDVFPRQLNNRHMYKCKLAVLIYIVYMPIHVFTYRTD